MRETNETATALARDEDSYDSSEGRALLRHLGAADLTGASGHPMARFEGERNTLTISLQQDQVVIERWVDDAKAVPECEPPTRAQYTRLVVTATDELERRRFIDELAARISAQTPQMSVEAGLTPIQIGELRIDRESHRVTINEREIDLTAIEYKLLVTLVERRDRVIDRRTLLRDVWAVEGDERGRRVDIAVRRLRVKLDEAARFLETLRGFGYRFSERPPEPDEPPAPPVSSREQVPEPDEPPVAHPISISS